MRFLCYDIKGIQRYIFSVPKLKAIIGGSCLIDEFDRQATQIPGNIYAGGGKGAFYRDESDPQVEEHLKSLAHQRGLDIQFGEADSLQAAANGADRLFPYIPEQLTAYPCETSGILPAPSAGKTNEKILMRMQLAKTDDFGAELLRGLRDQWPTALSDYEPEFFKSLKDDRFAADAPGDNETDRLHSRAASIALGQRNRWAVIAMDGNDIGSQYRAFAALERSESEFIAWLREMSSALKQCTRNSFLAAVHAMIEEWSQAQDVRDCSYDDSGVHRLVLPIRPLVLGGDDLIVLCHPSYAFAFVQEMIHSFERNSEELAKKATTQPLWPGSNNRLTISAGILFTNAHLPLNLAIPYAEALLKNAKRRARQFQREIPEMAGVPSPSALDFETVTDSLLDNPSDRRRRELMFRDEELGGVEVALTRKPYLLLRSHTGNSDHRVPLFADLVALRQQLARLPRSIRSTLLMKMCEPWSERTTFLASIAKRHEAIYELLSESPHPMAPGWFESSDRKRRETSVVDALLMLEEEDRAQWVTT